MSEQWPVDLPVARVRIARPTDRLEEVVAFYRDGIGLPVIGSFEGHAGYSGIMLGLPRTNYHLWKHGSRSTFQHSILGSGNGT